MIIVIKLYHAYLLITYTCILIMCSELSIKHGYIACKVNYILKLYVLSTMIYDKI